MVGEAARRVRVLEQDRWEQLGIGAGKSFCRGSQELGVRE